MSQSSKAERQTGKAVNRLDVVSLDVGRGTVVCVYGRNDNEFIFQAGAAPADRVGTELGLELSLAKEPLLVDGKEWYAGVPISSVEYDRNIALGEYERTPAYEALFLEALDRLDCAAIGTLVMGLPTSSYDDASISFLKTKFAGRHDVRGRTVEIDQVLVADQPLGSLNDFVAQGGGLEDYDVAIVIDIGERTTDISRIREMKVQRHQSFSSLMGMNAMRERMSEIIFSQHQLNVTANTINSLLAAGANDARKALTFRGKEIDLQKPWIQAAKDTARLIVDEIQTKTAGLSQVSWILLTGGGSDFFKDPIAGIVSDIPICTPKDPVKGNARGFYWMANGRADDES